MGRRRVLVRYWSASISYIFFLYDSIFIMEYSHNAKEYNDQIKAEMYVPAFWYIRPTDPLLQLGSNEASSLCQLG